AQGSTHSVRPRVATGRGPRGVGMAFRGRMEKPPHAQDAGREPVVQAHGVPGAGLRRRGRRPGAVLRLTSAAELLSLVPYRLGFHPRESAVLVCLRGARREVGLLARVDLADLAAPDGEVVARTVLGRLVQDDARGLVVVAYTASQVREVDRPGPAASGGARTREVVDADAAAPTAHAALDVLLRVMRPVLGPVQTWVVGEAGYFELDCGDETCCPAGGRPLTELQSTVVGAQMVVRGRVVAPDRADLARIPEVAAAERTKAQRAYRRSLGTREQDRDRWR